MMSDGKCDDVNLCVGGRCVVWRTKDIGHCPDVAEASVRMRTAGLYASMSTELEGWILHYGEGWLKKTKRPEKSVIEEAVSEVLEKGQSINRTALALNISRAYLAKIVKKVKTSGDSSYEH
ncbi:unnamed protein product [Acanthoscelides obtectus]|uniref:Uncharacterized protein n=1 Tax=Acanthoscelides obtectus TaxID=200917 RepID=A0A9P0M4W6_ACAOB|nr:unnamed protein product [Acanthoscelides obtectus]CAK1638478.1 hypothetical protein AOBTE_LOCUS10628 [Acanthoscelides obtectus]